MNYEPDIVTIVDDDGNEYDFEELDRVETEDGQKYVALVPIIDEESEDDSDEESAELIFLRVIVDNDDTFLEPIDDENEFNEVSEIFTERLSEYFDIE